MRVLPRFTLPALLPLLLCQPLLAEQSCNRTNVPATTPSTEFTVHGDGTVTHHRTGLMWMQCSLGQTWGGGNCTGDATTFSWQAALAAQPSPADFAGYSDWRLPNKNELVSIVERQCSSPWINLAVFPGTPSVVYWSSSPRADIPTHAWAVGFSNGLVGDRARSDSRRVRLVRAGQ